MKKIIGWPVTWILFWMGDLTTKPMHYLDWGWLYPAYNNLMSWSVDVQDWAQVKGPWRYNG